MIAPLLKKTKKMSQIIFAIVLLHLLGGFGYVMFKIFSGKTGHES